MGCQCCLQQAFLHAFLALDLYLHASDLRHSMRTSCKCAQGDMQVARRPTKTMTDIRCHTAHSLLLGSACCHCVCLPLEPAAPEGAAIRNKQVNGSGIKAVGTSGGGGVHLQTSLGNAGGSGLRVAVNRIQCRSDSQS